MKELNEYKEEIFRRSAQKKRQLRKKRRILFSVGVPLCLCCVITLAMIPNLSLDKMAFAPSKGETCDSVAPNENGMLSSSAESFLVIDPVDVAMVQAVLDGAHLEYSSTKDEPDDEQYLGDQAEPGEYRLILQYADGSTVRYHIWGQEVYCETNAESRSLTEEQANLLYSVLMQVADAQ